ncbi:dTMP kinase [Roseomonas xinghualingensis]|uniref:dTMP kinase n=1 Tax=Roseomonas xinghualingensis TaxID=2986475 RepID=UPI0021F1AAD5|nr:dTMP kinase [Roseomonas sp. SXEYE001]MCV4209162.1 dTMP kinase [Roseomonas sp. SXEYE001]
MGPEPGTRGRFITLEGGEGAGKTTLSRALTAKLAAEGLPVLRTREPGGAPGAEAVRGLILGHGPWDPVAEAMLHFAARREHVARTILPALEAGIWVVCDRFADSTLAYQGAGQGLSREVWETLCDLALGTLRPDLTLVLDLPPERGMGRALARGDANRYEMQGADFHARVRAAFLAIAAHEPGRCAVLDASRGPQEVLDLSLAAIRERLGIAA